MQITFIYTYMQPRRIIISISQPNFASHYLTFIVVSNLCMNCMQSFIRSK